MNEAVPSSALISAETPTLASILTELCLHFEIEVDHLTPETWSSHLELIIKSYALGM